MQANVGMNFSMSSSELHRKFPTASYVHVPQPCSPFYILKCSEKSCSESTASGTNQLDMAKCEANLALDQKVDFSQNYPCQKYCAFNPVQPQMETHLEQCSVVRLLGKTRALSSRVGLRTNLDARNHYIKGELRPGFS